MTAGLFPVPKPHPPRRRRPRPVPPGLGLLVIQTRRSLVLDTDRAPDLIAAAGCRRFQRATDGSTHWLVPVGDLMRILRAAERQQRTVTVRDDSR